MPSEPIARLERDGVLERVEGELRTTRRWKGAMMRAAARLASGPLVEEDLRVPIALALDERYGDSVELDEFIACIHALAAVELRELGLVAARRAM